MKLKKIFLLIISFVFLFTNTVTAFATKLDESYKNHAEDINNVEEILKQKVQHELDLIEYDLDFYIDMMKPVLNMSDDQIKERIEYTKNNIIPKVLTDENIALVKNSFNKRMNFEKELAENTILVTNNKDEFLNKIKEIINGLPVSEKDKLIDSYINQVNDVEGYHYDITGEVWDLYPFGYYTIVSKNVSEDDGKIEYIISKFSSKTSKEMTKDELYDYLMELSTKSNCITLSDFKKGIPYAVYTDPAGYMHSFGFVCYTLKETSFQLSKEIYDSIIKDTDKVSILVDYFGEKTTGLGGVPYSEIIEVNFSDEKPAAPQEEQKAVTETPEENEITEQKPDPEPTPDPEPEPEPDPDSQPEQDKATSVIPVVIVGTALLLGAAGFVVRKRVKVYAINDSGRRFLKSVPFRIQNNELIINIKNVIGMKIDIEKELAIDIPKKYIDMVLENADKERFIVIQNDKVEVTRIKIKNTDQIQKYYTITFEV